MGTIAVWCDPLCAAGGVGVIPWSPLRGGWLSGKFHRDMKAPPEDTRVAAANSSAYVAGKRGLDGIVRVLAKEVGEDQVTVNQIAPGWTISDSDRHRDTTSEMEERYRQTVPLKRRGTDQEVANVVAFVASDLASFITGAYIPVCGGRVMPGI
ncbi:MAG: SDR family NAD(P)-dependent oxidoreductase [Bacilli bacterium]